MRPGAPVAGFCSVGGRRSPAAYPAPQEERRGCTRCGPHARPRRPSGSG